MITASAILAWIAAAASNPYTLVAIAGIIMAIPNETLVRLPLIGSFFATWIRFWATQKLKQFKEQREAIDAEADRIVREKEQTIKTGKIDQVTAGATATADLAEEFGLPPEIAKRIVEAAVNRMNHGALKWVQGEALGRIAE